MTKILIFSPYALWTIHTIYEKTIARACQAHGAKVDYLLCDGLLPECDLHWDSKANTPRPLDICTRCQAAAATDLQETGIPHRKLGEFVDAAATAAAFAWAQGLTPGECEEASFEGVPVSQWVRSSVISYFRQFPPDLTNWHVVNVYRGFLYSAAIVATGLKNYLNANDVDAAILFNGRQSITRVAFELFRQRGIRVLTHERAEYSRGHINVRPNSHCMSPKPFGDLWGQWAHVALDRPSLEAAGKWLLERRTGTNLAWIPFNSRSQTETAFRTKMNLSADKKLWVLFTSSTDEIAGDPEWKGPFTSQHVWIREVVQWVAKRDDVQLIIKVHPNLGGNLYIGKATDELRIYEEMKSNLPPNVRIALPEDAVDAYLLSEEADVGLTFGSIIGLEMAMLGKPVLVASRALYDNCSTILSVRSSELLPAMLEKCLDSTTNREIQREAFRLASCYISRFELEFPTIKVLNIFQAEPNYSQPEDLGAGKDASLDRICNYLIDGDPLYESPSALDLARTTDEENAFFDDFANPQPYTEEPPVEKPKPRTLRDRIKGRLLRLPFASRIAHMVGDGDSIASVR
jgi:hypothetical protein